MDDHMNQNKFINHSWDVEMAMEDDQIIFHHDPSTLINSPPSLLWPSFMSTSFISPQTHTPIMIPPHPSSSQIIPPPPPSSSSTLLFGGHGHHQITNNNNNIINIGQDHEDHHDHQEAEEDQEQDQEEEEEEEEEELGAMKEMMYRIAAMQPVDIDPSTVSKPKRRNIRISDDPQSVAARHRRERISEKIRILQRLVPGGTKLDTASMLDEAIRYVKFLKRQIRLLQSNQCLGDHYNKLSLATTTTTTTTTTASTSGGAAAAVDPILGHNFPFVSFRRE